MLGGLEVFPVERMEQSGYRPEDGEVAKYQVSDKALEMLGPLIDKGSEAVRITFGS